MNQILDKIILRASHSPQRLQALGQALQNALVKVRALEHVHYRKEWQERHFLKHPQKEKKS